GRVSDAIEPCEKLRPSIKTVEGLPCFPVCLLSQIGGQIAVGAQTVQRSVDRRVCPLDELFRRAAIPAARRREQPPLFVPRRQPCVRLRRRCGERKNAPNPSGTPLRDIWKPRSAVMLTDDATPSRSSPPPRRGRSHHIL